MSIGIQISLELTHTIADGDVWVVCHPDADETITARCDSEPYFTCQMETMVTN